MTKIISPHGGMVHWNGNLVCAVDVETTGVDANYHEMFQLAIVPLDSDFKPLKTVLPFYVNIKPQFPERITAEALNVTNKTFASLMQCAIDPDQAADLLNDWFDVLDLPLTNAHHKKIQPLWSNGDFDKSFLIAWLGADQYNHYFHFHSRDTQAVALEINDRFYWHGEKIPFPKVGVKYLASCFDIVQPNAHDALADCISTAEIYRRMMTMYMPSNVGAPKAEGPEVDYSR